VILDIFKRTKKQLPPQFAIIDYTEEAKQLRVDSPFQREIKLYSYGSVAEVYLHSNERIKILREKGIPVVDMSRRSLSDVIGSYDVMHRFRELTLRG